MTRARGLALASLLSLATFPVAAQEVRVDSETFGGLEARAIGPAAMSGRVAALDAVPGDRTTIYVGAASGGVWKSTDGGLQFKPLFDKHSQSIGAVALDPSNPKTIWVGTGETWTRNSVSVGDGVYRSTDGGENWQKMGLESSERIARIAVDPKSGDTVFVCATGHAFDSHPERGVFRSKDGGKSWEKVLFVDADTGCADLVMDPQNAKVLYAGMWQFRREPYFFTSGGKGSGLYKSSDGGATWRKLSKGLPAGNLGRIALAVAPSKSEVVYANVEAKSTALYRSDDGGESWQEVNRGGSASARPFYFSRLVADPQKHDRVYKAGFSISVSDDGGKTFSGLGAGGPGIAGYHGDTHALWINPKNTDELILGTDGGVYVSQDRGHHWRFVGSLPISQFYHVSHDLAVPYNVYGGLQDNASWYGPSRKPGGIAAKHWEFITYGDGFWVFPDPKDENIVYSEYQGGNLFRSVKFTLEQKDIRPYPGAGEPKYRFNWNTPIHMSPTRPGRIYYGAQFLFRSDDRGESWQRLSPDLTTNNPAKLRQDESGGLTLDNSTAENHCTIFTISESPRNGDLIWVGTDDGNVQLTRDGGKTWTNVAANVPGLPKSTWVSSIQAGRFDEGTAYATFDGHMTGDMKTYVYKTSDFGKTWQSLATADVKGYGHVVKEDPVKADLLFLGTESGLFVSLNGGKEWGQFRAGLPSVAVRDMVIHPSEHDLILATHGRGVYIVDDITPLRHLTPEVLASDVAFLPTRPSVMTIPAFTFSFNGDNEFEGRSPGEVASIVYYLKKRHMFGDLKLQVYDANGQLLSEFAGSKRRGINRVEWPMRMPPPKLPEATSTPSSFYSFVGPRAPEGTYTVKMIKGKDTFTSEIRLVPDPRAKYSAEDRALQQQVVRKLYGMMGRFTYVVDSIMDARDQARARAEALPPNDALRKRLAALQAALEKQRTDLVSTKQSEGGVSGEEKLREEMGTLYGNVNGYEGRPTDSQLRRMEVLGKDMEAARGKYEALLAKELASINASLGKQGREGIKPLAEEDWQKRQKK